MANKRIYYAIQQVKLGTGSDKVELHGLQSVGMTTNFTLDQVFELGQLDIYQNVEEVPEIEVTLNKVLDGYPLIYTEATETGTGIGTFVADSPTLTGRQNARCDLELAIFGDNEESATGSSPVAVVICSGMYVSSVSYTFPVDGNFTEDVTLVGNNKVWGTTATGAFTSNDDSPASANESVGRRQYLDVNNCFFPVEIPGVTVSGKLDDNSASGEGFSTHFQNITVSCDLGREAINELGRFGPYHRYVTFPVEVTSEFEVLAIDGDGINATEEGYRTGPGSGDCQARFNLQNQTILLQTCEGTRISLGTKNKLSSVNYTGGDTGGGNVTVTYSYTTFNDFVVAHSGSTAEVAGSGWYDYVVSSGYYPAA